MRMYIFIAFVYSVLIASLFCFLFFLLIQQNQENDTPPPKTHQEKESETSRVETEKV